MNTEEIIISEEEIEPCLVKFNITVTKQKVTQTYKKILKDYKNHGKIPGFRPGKAPMSLLEKKFAKQIYDQVKQDIMESVMKELFIKSKRHPISYPTLDEKTDLKKGQEYNLSMTNEVAPKFDLPEYKGIQVRKDLVKIEDSAVDEVIKTFCTSRKTYEVIEEPAEKEDMLKISYTSTFEEPTDDLNKHLIDAKETWLVIQTPELIPGSIEALVGKSAGDKVENIDVVFPEDYANKSFASKKATYSFEIHEVHKCKIPEFTDEMAKGAGMDTKEDFIKGIREQLENVEENKSKQKMADQILKHFNDVLDFDLPASMLKQEVDVLEKTLLAKEEDKLKNSEEKEITDERKAEIHAKAEKMAKNTLRISFFIQLVAEKEGLSVTRDDMDEHIKQMSIRYRQSEELIREYMEKNGGMHTIEFNLLSDKVMDVLVEYAHVTSSEEKTNNKDK